MLCCADMIVDSIELCYCADTNWHQSKSFLEQIVTFINNIADQWLSDTK